MLSDAGCNTSADQESVLQLHESMPSWSQWQWPRCDELLHVHQWSLHGNLDSTEIEVCCFLEHSVCFKNLYAKLTWARDWQVLTDPIQRAVYDEIHGYAATATNPFFDDSAPRDHVFVDEFSCIGIINYYITKQEFILVYVLFGSYWLLFNFFTHLYRM
jgi:hypothetical protein